MRGYVSKNQFLDGIAYRTKNVVIHQTQEGKKKKRCYIIGNGQSLSIDDKDMITKHDPIMRKFYPKINPDNSAFVFYFTHECSGLAAASKEIAKFVDELSEKYDEIFLVGHSKCGLCLYQASHYCKKKVILVTVSTPFAGTLMADKNSVDEKIKSRLLKKIYNRIFSNHNVDKDVMPNSKFIKSILPANCKEHINIESNLKNIFSCKCLADLFLLFWDRKLKIYGDGIVPLESQETKSTKTFNIYCSHATSLKRGLKLIDHV